MVFRILLFFFSISFWSCQSTNFVDNGQYRKNEPNGWVDKNTYQLWINTEWEHKKYYIKDIEIDNIDTSKTPLSIIQLRKLKRKSVQIIAIKNFKNRIYKIFEEKYKVNKDSYPLIIELIEAIAIRGNKVKFRIIKEVYNQNGTANLMIHFNYSNLREIVEQKIKDAYFAAKK